MYSECTQTTPSPLLLNLRHYIHTSTCTHTHTFTHTNTHTHTHAHAHTYTRREGRRCRDSSLVRERRKEGGREEGETERKRGSLLCSLTHFLVRVECFSTYTVVTAAILGKTILPC